VKIFFLIMISSIFYLNAGELGIVVDNKTGLAWQDDYYNGENSKRTTWQDALIYCEELTLGAKNDWRLPNIKELKSIVDRNKYNPTISSTFTNIISDTYWSSTTHVSTPGAWVIFFEDGFDGWRNKSDEHYVRCVRGGQ